MKVLILAMKYIPASGGSAYYPYYLATGLQQHGHQVKILAPKYTGRKSDDSAFPFPVHRMFLTETWLGGFRIYFAAINVLWTYVRFRPDTIWATSFSGCRVLGVIPFIRAVYIGTIHGGGIHRRYPSKKILKSFGDFLGKRFMYRADAIVTVSELSKKIITDKITDPRITQKIRIVLNGIDFDESKFLSKENSLKVLPQLKDRRIIFTIGRLIKAKGHDVVIHAIHELKQKFPNILYIIAGEGPESESLREIVGKLKLNDHVHFAGYISDEMREAYYGASDLFVMAGRWTPNFVEMFGVVFIEAGIRGKAVIGTRVGGIPEAIFDNKTGFIIEPENPAVLAEKISLLLEDETLRNTMGSFAYRYVKENFSNDVMAKNNSKLLEDVSKQPLNQTIQRPGL